MTFARRFFYRPTLALLTTLALASLHPATASEFADRLGTLELDAKLDARGNLGGMTVDRLGFLYVANFRDAVWKVSPDGEVTELSRSLYGASGNAVDARGDLYQANFLGQTITRIRRTGEVETFVDEGLAGPVGLVFDTEGRLVVCNCQGNTLGRVLTDGMVETFAESELFACPNGIVLGPDGHFYVTNFNHHDLLRVSPAGEVAKFANVPGGAGNAHLVFSKGFFYVTKIISNKIVKVSLEGEVFPLAGNGSEGHDDGSALEGSLAHPNGITISPTGDRLYVNTMIGTYSQPQPSRITIRTVDLTTLGSLLREALETHGLDEMTATYERYKADPVRGLENTVAEMVTFGYSYLSQRKVPEALTIFGLNAASYPDSPAARYHLGEAYRYTGQTEKAIEQYHKTLELDPAHQNAASKLAQLSGGG